MMGNELNDEWLGMSRMSRDELNGHEIPPGYVRVTDVTSLLSPYGHIDPIVLGRAALRGSLVHEWIAETLKGEAPPDLEPDFQGYSMAWRAWDLLHGSSPVKEVETRYFDHRLKLTGQIDVMTQDLIIDWKTSSAWSKTWELQMQAYMHLTHTPSALVVQLLKSGKFRMKKIDYCKYRWMEFVSLLAEYRAAQPTFDEEIECD